MLGLDASALPLDEQPHIPTLEAWTSLDLYGKALMHAGNLEIEELPEAAATHAQDALIGPHGFVVGEREPERRSDGIALVDLNLPDDRRWQPIEVRTPRRAISDEHVSESVEDVAQIELIDLMLAELEPHQEFSTLRLR